MTPRATFELAAGCLVTEVIEEQAANKKIFSFWVVWAHDKNSKSSTDEEVKASVVTSVTSTDDESDDEVTTKDKAASNDVQGDINPDTAAANTKVIKPAKREDLKYIVESEVLMNKRKRVLVEKQLERHQAHDAGVSLGVKVAAVAVGGLLIGAFTAGIGLVPYMAVVGVTAVVGGTSASGSLASLNWRRPSDSRLIMACETMGEALEWKDAIERVIGHVEETQKPSLPSIVDPSLIWAIIKKANHTDKSLWRLSSEVEGLCIMEHRSQAIDSHICNSSSCGPASNDGKTNGSAGGGFAGGASGLTAVQAVMPAGDYIQRRVQYGRPSALRLYVHQLLGVTACLSEKDKVKFRQPSPAGISICRKAQLSVNSSSPINTFLHIMNTKTWPRNGTSQVKREIDDHADIIEVEVYLHNEAAGGGCGTTATRRIVLSRFWKLDDDGIYLITLNTVPATATTTTTTATTAGVGAGSSSSSSSSSGISLDAVVTISPRKDAANFEYELAESMITVICQASLTSPPPASSSCPLSSGSGQLGEWTMNELACFVDTFITDHLLEVRRSLVEEKFSILSDTMAMVEVDNQEDKLDLELSNQPDSMPTDGRVTAEESVGHIHTGTAVGPNHSGTGPGAARDAFDERLTALQRISADSNVDTLNRKSFPQAPSTAEHHRMNTMTTTTNTAATTTTTATATTTGPSGAAGSSISSVAIRDGVSRSSSVSSSGSSNGISNGSSNGGIVGSRIQVTRSITAPPQLPSALSRRSKGVTKTQPGLDEAPPPAFSGPALGTTQHLSKPQGVLQEHQPQPQQQQQGAPQALPIKETPIKKGKISSFFTRKGTSTATQLTLSEEHCAVPLPPPGFKDGNSSGESSPLRPQGSRTSSFTLKSESADKDRGIMHTDSNISAGAEGEDFNGRKKSPWRRGKMDKESNSQAIFLRNQIAAKEYEMHRNVKNIRKKTIVGTANPSASTSTTKDKQDTADRVPLPVLGSATPTSKFAHKYEKNQISAQELFALQWQQDELYTQSKELKSKYLVLTGESYDDVQARKKKIPYTKRRLIRNRTKDTSKEYYIPEKDCYPCREVSRDYSTGTYTTAPPGSLVPFHWASDSQKAHTKGSANVMPPSEYALNLSLVLVFAVCAVASSVLSSIISHLIAS